MCVILILYWIFYVDIYNGCMVFDIFYRGIINFKEILVLIVVVSVLFN